MPLMRPITRLPLRPPPRPRPLPVLHPQCIHRRTLFGIGEIMGVLTNPARTLQQLSDVRRELNATRAEMAEAKERDRLPPKKTFVQTQNYFPRPIEEGVLERILEGPPELTVIFGATSVGKTALLRHVLLSPRYFVLPLDLRIPGFSDPPSLFLALSTHFEQFFNSLGQAAPGCAEECHNIALSFKHQRLDVERRVDKAEERGEAGKGKGVGTADMAEMMGLLQSALVRYWGFVPKLEEKERSHKDKGKAAEEEKGKHGKPVPVWLIDEVHKLPELVQGEEGADYLRILMDAMVVLTKQERLCHIVQCTSLSGWMDILISLNIATHSKFLHLSDLSRPETEDYVRHQLLPRYSQEQQTQVLNAFDEIWDVIGGKVLHWEDGVREWVNEGVPITRSSHVSQAYVLVQSFLHPTTPELDELDPSAVKQALRLFDALSHQRPASPPQLVAPASSSGDTASPDLASSGPGPVLYYTAIDDYGSALISALLRERIVQVRWDGLLEPEYHQSRNARRGTDQLRESLQQDPLRRPLLVPMTPAIGWAMRRVVEESKEPAKAE